MSEENSADPSPVQTDRHVSPAPRPRRTLPSRLTQWLRELATVFFGVYAAFFLNNYANHRHERQRREQLLAWVEGRYAEVLDNTRQQIVALSGKIGDFNAKLAAGQMPEVTTLTWVGDYDPSDSTGLLQSGGYDLLDVETIRDLREAESSQRQLVSVAVHAQQRSDALILPNRGKGPAVFYDPDTRRLREPYEWLPKAYTDMKDNFEELQAKCTKLLAQVRTERARNR